MHKRTISRISIVAVLVIAGGLGGLWIRGSRPTVDAVAVTGLSAVSDKSIEARLTDIEQRLDELARLQSAALTAGSSSGAEPSIVRGKVPLQLDNEAMVAQRDRAIAQHEGAWRNSQGASSWGTSTSALLMGKTESDELLANEAPLPRTRDVECRGDMCRMEFGFSNESDAEMWADAYMANLGDSVGRIWSVTLVAPDGTARIRMYGFR